MAELAAMDRADLLLAFKVIAAILAASAVCTTVLVTFLRLTGHW